MDDKSSGISFSGRRKDWACWKVRFIGTAHKKEFRDILLKQVTAPEEYKSDMTDEEKILLKQHDFGFTELMLSMKDDRLMMMVSNSITREHPTGDLIVAWEKLCNEFSPKDVDAKLDLYDSIRQTKLEFGRNPDHWYEEFNNKLNKLNVEFGEKLSEEELIHIILTNLPDEYDDLKMQFYRQRKSTVEPLTLDSMTSQLRDYHKYSKAIKEIKLKDLSLNTVDISKKESFNIKDKKFKICSSCGKGGHDAEDCWRDLRCGVCGRKVHPTQICYDKLPCGICGQKGHESSRCWKDEKK